MRLLTYLRRLASAWWGVVFHASTWFAHRFERDAGRRRAWLEPLAFACIVAAPSLGAGVFVDAWVTGVPADRAVARAMIALLISPVLALLGVLVTAALAHGVLRVMGVDRGRFGQTLSCVGFAAAPELFAIVPFVGPLVAGVWRLVLLAQSLQIAHGLRRYRAFIAVFAGPAWLVGIGLAFRLSLVDAYKVPAGSMIPTILPGDHLLVRRGPYDPERGDVMIFRYPEDPTTFFVKRVVGLAGDEVRMLVDRPIINGWPVPRCRVGDFEPGDVPDDWPERGTLFVEYLGEYAYLVFADRDIARTQSGGACLTERDCPTGQTCDDAVCVVREGPFDVGLDEYWVLGDNRYNSHDSRRWYDGRGGGVPESFMTGPAVMIWAHVRRDGGMSLERFAVPIVRTPRVAGPLSDALETRLRWCLEHRPLVKDATPPEPEQGS